jgi:hypothetical protein
MGNFVSLGEENADGENCIIRAVILVVTCGWSSNKEGNTCYQDHKITRNAEIVNFFSKFLLYH